MQHFNSNTYIHKFSFLYHSSIAPATFVKKLNNSNVESGQPITLQCTYVGSPTIAVTWQKNGRDISQSERCSITTTEKSCLLEIFNATQEDDGEYTCIVANEAGKDTCSALLSVLGLYLLNEHFKTILSYLILF